METHTQTLVFTPKVNLESPVIECLPVGGSRRPGENPRRKNHLFLVLLSKFPEHFLQIRIGYGSQKWNTGLLLEPPESETSEHLNHFWDHLLLRQLVYINMFTRGEKKWRSSTLAHPALLDKLHVTVLESDGGLFAGISYNNIIIAVTQTGSSSTGIKQRAEG